MKLFLLVIYSVNKRLSNTTINKKIKQNDFSNVLHVICININIKSFFQNYIWHKKLNLLDNEKPENYL